MSADFGARGREILAQLVGFATPSHSSNLDLIAWVETRLAAVGAQVQRIPAPCGTKAGLYAAVGPGTAGIVLSAHSDVVPAEGQNWTRTPWQLQHDQGRFWGRGVTDMKGFLAQAIAALEWGAATPLRQRLALVLSYDEEVGCVGLRQMMPALRPYLGQPELLIVGEPTGMVPGLAHKGKAAFHVRFRGQAGHSALAPQFTNALHPAVDFVQAVRALQAEVAQGHALGREKGSEITYPTLHIGRLQGGRALNLVPDLAEIDMELRHPAACDVMSILSKMKQAAAQAVAPFGAGAQVEIEERFRYPAFEAHGAGAGIGLARSLVGAGPAEGLRLSYGTEAGYFAQEGLECVVMGPGEMARDGHQPDEGLDVAQFDACGAMMARILARLGAA